MRAASAEPACETRRILVGRFHADLRVYVDYAMRLDGLMGAGFDAGYQHAERARIAFEQARFALKQHEVEHGCAL